LSQHRVEKLTVTGASDSDIQSIHDFLLEAWREAGPSAWGWTGATEENVHAMASSETLQHLISNPKVKLFLGRDGNQVVGFAANRAVDESTAELTGIVVQERYTGRGVGKALINAAIESATAQGFRSIIVKTEPFNERALAFYKSSGFNRVGLTTEEVDGTKIELVMLKLGLST
jgi:ribosomal protein S18 acetylase RimI-like enzyme